MLGSAVVRCGLRRLHAGLARSPLLAAAAVALVAAGPVLLWRAGGETGRALAPLLADRRAALVLLLPLLLAAALLGATLTLVARGELSLDAQLRAAPVSRGRLVLATTVLPLALATAAASVLFLATALPFASALPGGSGAAAALLAGVSAAGAVGAVLAEGAVAAARRSPLAGAVLAMALLAAAVDPLGGLTRALLDPGATDQAAIRACILWAAASAVWVLLVVRRPPPRAVRNPRLALPLPRGAAGAWHVAALARYGRRRELLQGAGAGVAGGALGAAVLAAAGAGGESAVVLGATTALLGAAVFPLAHHGLDLHARWLWLGTRGRGGAAAVVAAAAAAALALAAVAAVAGPAALLASAGLRPAAGVAVMSGGGVALALLAGVVVPWRDGGLGEQLASFGALAGLALCASVAVAAAAGPALRLVPEPLFASAVVMVPALAALALAVRSFGSLP